MGNIIDYWHTTEKTKKEHKMEYKEEIGRNALLSEFAYIKFENYTNYKSHIYASVEELLNSSDTKEMKLFIDSSESGVADDRKEAMKNLLLLFHLSAGGMHT